MPAEFQMTVSLKAMILSETSPERALVPGTRGQFRTQIAELLEKHHIQARLKTMQEEACLVVTGMRRELMRLMTLVCTIAECSDPTPAPME